MKIDKQYPQSSLPAASRPPPLSTPLPASSLPCLPPGLLLCRFLNYVPVPLTFLSHLAPGRPRAGLSGDPAVTGARALSSRGFRGRGGGREAGLSHLSSHIRCSMFECTSLAENRITKRERGWKWQACMSVDLNSAFHTQLHASPCGATCATVVRSTVWAVEAISGGGFDSSCFSLHTLALDLHQRLAPLSQQSWAGRGRGTAVGLGTGCV